LIFGIALRIKLSGSGFVIFRNVGFHAPHAFVLYSDL
jgi:hypothetical protein